MLEWRRLCLNKNECSFHHRRLCPYRTSFSVYQNQLHIEPSRNPSLWVVPWARQSPCEGRVLKIEVLPSCVPLLYLCPSFFLESLFEGDDGSDPFGLKLNDRDRIIPEIIWVLAKTSAKSLSTSIVRFWDSNKCCSLSWSLFATKALNLTLFRQFPIQSNV